MLIYWKAIQFGILEALSYVTIKRKFQTYFPCLYDVVVMYLGDYLRWWSLKIVEYWNSVFIQSWRKEKLGYEYTTSYEDMKKFKCRFWSLSLPTFKIARGQNLFAVQTFQKKDSLEFFQWQTILVKKTNPLINVRMLKGIRAAQAPAELQIPISPSRLPSHSAYLSLARRTLLWASWNCKGKKGGEEENNVKLNKATLSTGLADSFHELASAPLAWSWLVLQLCRLLSDAPR